ncbi:MAG: AbrB/MazE/SpoVT family DNA-binding domain-containing protein [Candidatus Omnitrophota bacterium]|nr:AbrB/MazE/SpoVT family DNA-binding domain-containing protein [Candidatus Omnitrophota bacterium]
MVTQIRRNFQITLPASIRKRLGLNIGDLVETTVKEGKIILIPKKTIDAEQSWFWTKEWQEAEKEADSDLKSGKVKKFKSVEDLIKNLDK